MPTTPSTTAENADSVDGPPREFADRERVVAEFERLFYECADQTWRTVTWMGVPALKLPLDLWALQEIVFETRPGLILETGVHRGGTTLYLASLLDLIDEGEVVGVDVDLSQVDPRVRAHPRIRLLEGDSTSAEVAAAVQAAASGRRVMIDLDASHRAETVSAELRSLAPLVSPGCYLVVEDTAIRDQPVLADFGPGPGEALAEWLASGVPFDVDRSRERMLATLNRGGYLRRRGELAAVGPDAPPPSGPAEKDGDRQAGSAEAARLRSQVDQQALEIASLRRSLLASSRRVRELDVALEQGRALAALRERSEAESAARLQEAFVEMTRLRRRVLTLRQRLARREKSLRQATKRARRLEEVERSPAYRAARRAAAWPVAGRVVRRALPTRRR